MSTQQRNPACYCLKCPRLYDTAEETQPDEDCDRDARWSGENLVTIKHPNWISAPWLSSVCDNASPPWPAEIAEYSFILQFEIPEILVPYLVLHGRYTVDNFLLAIEVNGTPATGVDLSGSFGAWTNLEILPGNWVPGTNTLDFIVQNNSLPQVISSSPMGLAVEWNDCTLQLEAP